MENTSNNNSYDTIITKCENPKIIEDKSANEVLSEANGEHAYFEEPKNGDTNGFTVHQKYSQEVELEVDENYIERVIQKQETYEFFCSNCNSCITKRVLLKKRERKQGDISEPSPGERAPVSCFGAVSGFSCFSVFVPKGEVIVPIPDETPIPQPPRPGVSGLDIIKAIVYGGLLECITSLSVISSAAGVDATTLNIVALGLANVFGGLVLLLQNLRVLKHEQAKERYEDQLGRPGNFLLHAVVAVISYLVFGLMSPIIYGFAFRKSDNKDYKLATLAAASLVGITFLSIGKTYVRRPPKAYIQTIFCNISVGFMVSGAGYVAGDLINMLLKKLGVFDSRAPVSMFVPEGIAMKAAWSSY